MPIINFIRSYDLLFNDRIVNLTSLEYFDNAWRLYQYDPKQFEETNKKSKIIQLQEELSVITQEVAFQVSM